MFIKWLSFVNLVCLIADFLTMEFAEISETKKFGQYDCSRSFRDHLKADKQIPNGY